MHNIEINIINLDNRTDRWKHISNVFKNFKIKRFSAIKHKDGWKGCALSHIELTKYAIQTNLPYIIISEDDTYFKSSNWENTFLKILKYLEQNTDKWDLFRFATTLPMEKPNQTIKYINKELGIIKHDFAHVSNFLIYNKSAYNTILKLENSLFNIVEHSIDVYFNILDNKWTVVPAMSYQLDTYSDIIKNTSNYSKYFIDADNFYTKKLKN